MSRSTKPPEFASFLVKLAEDLTKQDIQKLSFIYKRYGASQAQLEKVKIGIHLIDIICKMDIISEGKLDDLIRNLKTISRHDLAKRCEAFNKGTNTTSMYRSLN